MIFRASGNAAIRLAELADVLTATTIVIAVIAALIALQAYAASTGLPVLELQMSFYLSRLNEPIFRATRQDEYIKTSDPVRQTELTVSVRNRGRYPARNVILTVKLSGLGCDSDEGFPHGDSWTVANATAEDGRFVGLAQWSSGLLVHASATLVLPPLHLGTLTYLPEWGDSRLCLYLLADGYRRSVEVPVVISIDDGGPAGKHSAKVPEWI